MIKHINLILIVIILYSAHICAFAASDAAQKDNSLEAYKLIYERNIFSRQRYSIKQSANGNGRTEKVVLSLYVLRGVAVEPYKKLAFVEDAISGQSKRLGVGDQLLNGTITEIQTNKVVFSENGKSRDIAVGQEFDRVESVKEISNETAEQSADLTNTENAPVKVAAPSSDSSLDEDALLKQMMERRKQELAN